MAVQTKKKIQPPLFLFCLINLKMKQIGHRQFHHH